MPRRLRRELAGRIDYHGNEMRPLDLTPLPEIVADFRAEGVEAVAICFIHSYANPSHEERALHELARLWPEVSAISSHQITREWREYERTSTVVLSAYVQPVAERYLQRLDAGLVEQGFGGGLYIMQSNCGVDSVDTVSRIPITMVESGPASGVWGAAELGRLIGEPNVLALDIGGTTAKCSLIEDADVRIKTDYWIGRSRAAAAILSWSPWSIWWRSATAAAPSPGSTTSASCTWAALRRCLAGSCCLRARRHRGHHHRCQSLACRINRDYFCGGTMEADMDAVQQAIEMVGTRLGVDPDEAARGIVRIANNNMVNALKLVSVNRGFDPRDFTLIAFGGGGAMHAVALAQELGVTRVVVPADASVFSAWGMMMSDLRRDDVVTLLVDLTRDNAAVIEAAYGEAEERARSRFAAEGIAASAIKLVRLGKFRYQNQEHTTEVPLNGGPVTADGVAVIEADFHETYEREYTYRLNAPVEMVGLHVVATVDIGKLTLIRRETTGRVLRDAQKGTRRVDYALEGVHEATIYDGELLEPGMGFDGPAIVEDPGTTIVIHPGTHAEVDDFGNIRIHIRN